MMKHRNRAPRSELAELVHVRSLDTLRASILLETGIEIPPIKRPLLATRIAKRMRQLNISSVHAYAKVVAEHEDEKARMLDCITTNETSFFREPTQFAFLEQRIVVKWKEEAKLGLRSQKIRAWSAACSTGEEPFSMAMSLLTHLPPSEGWSHEILASDLSNRVLERASEATWSMERSRDIPRAYLKSYMLYGVRAQQGLMRAGPELRRMISFRRINLNVIDDYPRTNQFDVIFCRNALIYFSKEARRRVVTNLLAHLAPSGFLFFGHAESVHGFEADLRSVMPNVYMRDA